MSINSSLGSTVSASLTRADRWRGRLGTAEAMACLFAARLAVAAVPFARWRDSLGLPASGSPDSSERLEAGRRLAGQVERAAVRAPFSTKCLPRAAALSWMLRRRRIGHAVVFAVRPEELRDSPDPLHAWVEVEGVKIIGDLPGPWVETLRLGG